MNFQHNGQHVTDTYLKLVLAPEIDETAETAETAEQTGRCRVCTVLNTQYSTQQATRVSDTCVHCIPYPASVSVRYDGLLPRNPLSMCLIYAVILQGSPCLQLAAELDAGTRKGRTVPALASQNTPNGSTKTKSDPPHPFPT